MACNGSQDLDHAVFEGAFNLYFRDSQAIIVAASTGTLSHNPACFTNYGSRISAWSWGNFIYAAGPDDLQNLAGCEQDYTAFFGGTSGANPIVAGPVVALSLIHEDLLGSWPSATTLRERLVINGTPQGMGFERYINKMPDMQGVLAPDLRPLAGPDWEADVVPKSAGGDPPTVPVELEPAPASTWFDWCFKNDSFYGLAEPAYSYT